MPLKEKVFKIALRWLTKLIDMPEDRTPKKRLIELDSSKINVIQYNTAEINNR